MRVRAAPLVSAFLVFATTKAVGQTPVTAPGGTLSGIVNDSVTGTPVGYALLILVERNQRVFATEGGRFSFAGLSSGTVTLRVQQIGYRSVLLRLVVDARSNAPASGLEIPLASQVVRLPEITVEAQACPAEGEPREEDGGVGTILDELFKNGERLLTLQRTYPYRATMQHQTVVLDSNRVRLSRHVDTLEIDSRELPAYERGNVIRLVQTRDLGRITFRNYANYFQASDLARPEFRNTHCFWYAGLDSVRGFPAYRIQFRPLPRVTTPDWAGSLLIDSASMHLLRSVARLVNLPREGAAFSAAECSALYVQLVPTLIHEFQAHCVTGHNTRPPAAFTDERWTLLTRAFINRRPDTTRPP